MDSAGFKFRSPFISARCVQPLWLAFTSLNSWKHTTARLPNMLHDYSPDLTGVFRVSIEKQTINKKTILNYYASP